MLLHLEFDAIIFEHSIRRKEKWKKTRVLFLRKLKKLPALKIQQVVKRMEHLDVAQRIAQTMALLVEFLVTHGENSLKKTVE